MEITYKGKVIKESSNPYVNSIYPVGTRVEADSYWHGLGWMPILNCVIDSAILDFRNVEWQTRVEIII